MKTLVLDRQFRSVGRIKRSTGTNDPKMVKLLDSMLDTLYRAGRIDILQAIQKGQLTLLEVWSRYRIGELDRLPTVETMRPLKTEMEAWVETADTGTWNRQSRKYSVHAILNLAKRDATLEDLPDLLRAYAATATGATMFNRVLSAAQAFARDTVGKSSPLYARIRDVRPKRVVKRSGNPQSPEQLAELGKTLDPRYTEIMWGMALTGMGPGEMWGKWTAYSDHIHIQGTKTSGRKRDVPFVRPIAKPTRLYRAFHDALEKVTSDVQVYDFRRSFALAMVVSGIPPVRQRVYMGHGAQSMTELYGWHDVQRFLKEDGDKLREYFGDAGKPTFELIKFRGKGVVSA
jgi:hypothetical protein